jgi:hypothetical protein
MVQSTEEDTGIQEVETVLGANGRPVRMGPNQEQLEDSHVHRYSSLNC